MRIVINYYLYYKYILFVIVNTILIQNKKYKITYRLYQRFPNGDPRNPDLHSEIPILRVTF